MKRDFLKNLGIEDKELIDKILDENSSDIGRAKGELQSYKDRVTELEQTLADKNNEIKTLEGKASTVDSLTEQVNTLQSEKDTLTNDLNTKVFQIQKAHAIENGVRDAKAKNVKAVMALLDMDKITMEDGKLNGLSEQLNELTQGDSTSFLFAGSQPTPPSGTHVNNPPSGGNGGNPPTSKTFAEAIANAIGKN